jgi:2,3-bisphosphoglycerate-independent phosphoglycerate mutase
MKHVVVIGDGMADFPLQELGGKTPLNVARKPHMDMMARKGFCGRVITVPEGFSPGSDVACMSIFGYDPARYYTGRAPIEAFGMGIAMADDDVAYRCNLVTLDMGPGATAMADYSGGHITTEEARVLIEALNSSLGGETLTFYPGVSYRHIMLWKKGPVNLVTTPPHDITGQDTAPYLPKGEEGQAVIALMRASQEVLANHPVNNRRRGEGKGPANSIWLWGQGKRGSLPSFFEKQGLTGATVTAVDLVKGISKMIGFDTPVVEGATGYLDTNYKAKAAKAMDLLADHDIVYIHVEAPDEASHNGNVEEKIRAIENIDREILGPLLEGVPDARFLIVTDHATPIVMKTHFAIPVPFAIFERGSERAGCPSGYDESTGTLVLSGEDLIDGFLRGFPA